ncbi:uncharacterized protein LOC142348357 [Convolutriloba macropyga]|uniref:uncharacterized protein LOC142348357 n=1 Tax=Convolutriloba macropyga TaxID=536237 RepID=UPI003F525999
MDYWILFVQTSVRRADAMTEKRSSDLSKSFKINSITDMRTEPPVVLTSTSYDYDGLRLENRFLEAFKEYDDGSVFVLILMPVGFALQFNNDGSLVDIDPNPDVLLQQQVYSIGTCDASNGGQNMRYPNLKGKLYPYKVPHSSPLSPSQNNRSLCSDSGLSVDPHAEGWTSSSDGGNCDILVPIYKETGYGAPLSDASCLLCNQPQTCVFETPCIYGYLDQTNLVNTLFTQAQLIGKFYSIADCAVSVAAVYESAWAVILDRPYDSSDQVVGGQHDCYYIESDVDYTKPVLEANSSYMACFLKGRNFCPQTSYAPRLEGIFAIGMSVSVSTAPNLMFEMMATGSNCVQMSYDAKQARAFGYVAKLLDDGSFECSFFTKDMGLDFNLSPTDSLKQPICLYNGPLYL